MCVSQVALHNFAMISPEDCCSSNAGSVEQHRKGSELADSSVSSIRRQSAGMLLTPREQWRILVSLTGK